MFTTVAYTQNLDPAGVDTKIAAVADPHVRVQGNDIYVPTLNRLMACAAMVSTTVTVQYARLDAPSLKRVSRYVIAGVQGAAAGNNLPADPQDIEFHYTGLPQLATNEAIDAIVNSDPAATQFHSVVLWLSDSAPLRGNYSEIFTIRASSVTAAGVSNWTNVGLVFDDVLPVGRYSIVGMRAESTNMIAARLVVPGYAWRPGVLGCNSGSHREDERFRRGELGEFAQFDEVTLFTVDVLANVADATQRFEFDVVKIS